MVPARRAGSDISRILRLRVGSRLMGSDLGVAQDIITIPSFLVQWGLRPPRGHLFQSGNGESVARSGRSNCLQQSAFCSPDCPQRHKKLTQGSPFPTLLEPSQVWRQSSPPPTVHVTCVWTCALGRTAKLTSDLCVVTVNRTMKMFLPAWALKGKPNKGGGRAQIYTVRWRRLFILEYFLKGLI